VGERVRGALPLFQLSGVKASVARRCGVCARSIVGPGDGVTNVNGDAAGRELEVGDRDRWISRRMGANSVSHTSSPRCAPGLPGGRRRCGAGLRGVGRRCGVGLRGAGRWCRVGLRGAGRWCRVGLRGGGRWCRVGLRGAGRWCRMSVPSFRRCGTANGEVDRRVSDGRSNGHLNRYVVPAGACVRVSDGRKRAGVRRVLRTPNEVPAVVGGAGTRVEHFEPDWAARCGMNGHRGQHERRGERLPPGFRLRRRDGNIGLPNRGRWDIGLGDTDVREDRQGDHAQRCQDGRASTPDARVRSQHSPFKDAREGPGLPPAATEAGMSAGT
jgi:hypothetical protein